MPANERAHTLTDAQTPMCAHCTDAKNSFESFFFLLEIFRSGFFSRLCMLPPFFFLLRPLQFCHCVAADSLIKEIKYNFGAGKTSGRTFDKRKIFQTKKKKGTGGVL